VIAWQDVTFRVLKLDNNIILENVDLLNARNSVHPILFKVLAIALIKKRQHMNQMHMLILTEIHASVKLLQMRCKSYFRCQIYLGAVVLNESKGNRRDEEQGWIEPRAVVALTLGILFNQPILLQFLHKLWEFFLHPLVDIMAPQTLGVLTMNFGHGPTAARGRLSPRPSRGGRGSCGRVATRWWSTTRPTTLVRGTAPPT
jgi:hypothetical protein